MGAGSVCAAIFPAFCPTCQNKAERGVISTTSFHRNQTHEGVVVVSFDPDLEQRFDMQRIITGERAALIEGE